MWLFVVIFPEKKMVKLLFPSHKIMVMSQVFAGVEQYRKSENINSLPVQTSMGVQESKS